MSIMKGMIEAIKKAIIKHRNIDILLGDLRFKKLVASATYNDWRSRYESEDISEEDRQRAYNMMTHYKSILMDLDWLQKHSGIDF